MRVNRIIIPRWELLTFHLGVNKSRLRWERATLLFPMSLLVNYLLLTDCLATLAFEPFLVWQMMCEIVPAFHYHRKSFRFKGKSNPLRKTVSPGKRRVFNIQKYVEKALALLRDGWTWFFVRDKDSPLSMSISIMER